MAIAVIDPKWIMWGGLAIPLVFILFDLEYSILIPAGAALWALFTLETNFVNKAEVERRNVPNLGAQQPFLPQQKSWEVNPETGQPYPTYRPPTPQHPVKENERARMVRC